MSDLGNKKVLASNLNYYMNINNIDRNKLCSDLGFKYTTVREWTNGTAYPRIDKIEELANYFGISKSDLIENKEHKQEDNEKSNLKTALQEAGLKIQNDNLTDKELGKIINFINNNIELFKDNEN